MIPGEAASNPGRNVKSHSSNVVMMPTTTVAPHSPRVSVQPVVTTTTTVPVTIPAASPVTTTTVPSVAPVNSAPVVSTAPTSAGVPAYVVAAFQCIATRESNNEPTVINSSSGDSGLYQFAIGTWLAFGGGQYAPQAYLATPAEQTAVAYTAWQQDGFSPWNGDNFCWN